MGVRTIRTGIGSYRDAEGRWTFGMHGDEVEVHEDDLERFDRLNPEEVSVEVEEESSDEPDEPSFSQADVDAAVQAAVDAKDAELAEGRKAVEDKAREVAKEIADLATAKAEFEAAQADAAKSADAAKDAATKTPAKTAGK